jgi:hypothetical protein
MLHGGSKTGPVSLTKVPSSSFDASDNWQSEADMDHRWAVLTVQKHRKLAGIDDMVTHYLYCV